jgi:acetyl-CoA carboxylase biotin carboxyl carrier protein
MAAKKKAPGAAPAGVDLEQVELLLAFMEERGLEEFEYSNQGTHIRLKRSPTNASWAGRAGAPPEIVVAGPNGAAGQAAAAAEAAAQVGEGEARGEDLHLVKSPIVGTFYEAPSPGAAPFVKVGDHVSAGQVLCIIEAMKLMNEIESDVAGEIVRVFVENGQPVEYGETLFAIRPTRKK